MGEEQWIGVAASRLQLQAGGLLDGVKRGDIVGILAPVEEDTRIGIEIVELARYALGRETVDHPGERHECRNRSAGQGPRRDEPGEPPAYRSPTASWTRSRVALAIGVSRSAARRSCCLSAASSERI